MDGARWTDDSHAPIKPSSGWTELQASADVRSGAFPFTKHQKTLPLTPGSHSTTHSIPFSHPTPQTHPNDTPKSSPSCPNLRKQHVAHHGARQG